MARNLRQLVKDIKEAQQEWETHADAALEREEAYQSRIAELEACCARLAVELYYAGGTALRSGLCLKQGQKIVQALNLERTAKGSKRRYYITEDGKLSYAQTK